MSATTTFRVTETPNGKFAVCISTPPPCGEATELEYAFARTMTELLVSTVKYDGDVVLTIEHGADSNKDCK